MDDSDDESSNSSSSEGSHSSRSSSSKSSSHHDQSPNRMMDVDHVIALQRRDSGLEEEEMSDEELDNPQIEANDMEVDKRDKKPSKKVHDDLDAESKRKMFRRKSSLNNPVSNDLPDVTEVDENMEGLEFVELREPSLSRRLDSGRESWTSSASSFESHRKSSITSIDSWRASRQSSSFEPRKRIDTWSSTGSQDSAFSGGAKKKRERFSRSGSQDSVTSQMGKMLNLNDEDIEDGKVPCS